MSTVALRSPRTSSLARLVGARKAPFPGFIAPCDPVQHETPPAGPGWLYEIKVDGYRAQLHVHRGDARVYSRRGLDWTGQFSTIADAAASLTDHDLVIDGEAVVYGATGLPDSQQLRRELGEHKSGRLAYHAFDLLYLDGYDLRGVAYVERKRRLEALPGKASRTFVYVE
jgi:bifunctional non-homologous end joining protein LigD